MKTLNDLINFLDSISNATPISWVDVVGDDFKIGVAKNGQQYSVWTIAHYLKRDSSKDIWEYDVPIKKLQFFDKDGRDILDIEGNSEKDRVIYADIEKSQIPDVIEY